jgi:hypothetical protein
MPSVVRNKRKNYLIFGGRTTENEKRERAAREEARGEELRRDHQQRHDGNEYYHTGRVRPLIDEE